MVVRTGFEPVNSITERIYSPRPLATWIPYQAFLKVLHSTNFLFFAKLFFKKFLNRKKSRAMLCPALPQSPKLPCYLSAILRTGGMSVILLSPRKILPISPVRYR